MSLDPHPKATNPLQDCNGTYSTDAYQKQIPLSPSNVTQTSGLCNLPNELLLHIHRHLPEEADRQCLRFVCKFFRSSLPPPLMKPRYAISARTAGRYYESRWFDEVAQYDWEVRVKRDLPEELKGKYFVYPDYSAE